MIVRSSLAIARRPRLGRRRRAGRWAVGAAAALALGLASEPAAAQDYPPSAPAPGRIVYTRQQQDVFDMFTSDPDGANERRLSDINDSAAGEDQPRWSPDGRWVAFTSFPKNLVTIDIIAADGGPVRTVVERDGTSGDPSWSPDGRCLAYDGGQGTSDEDQKRLDLKVWCDDGSAKGTVRRLTSTPDIDEREPDWSPDGQWIVFAAKGNAQSATDRWDLWRIRPDGTGRERFLAWPDTHERQPRYSPDGTRLAFITSRQPFSFGTLTVIDLADQSVLRCCDGASDALSWSPDSSEILFANIYRGGIRPAALAAAAPPLMLRAERNGDPYGALPFGARARAGAAPRSASQTGPQFAGLYRVALAGLRITRLTGAAGGAEAPNSGTNFEFGYMPDWSPGTATPTPDATATSTASPSPTASSTPTATATLEPTPTPPRIYLPDVRREAPPTPTAEATAEPSATGDATATGQATAEWTPTVPGVPTPAGVP